MSAPPPAAARPADPAPTAADMALAAAQAHLAAGEPAAAAALLAPHDGPDAPVARRAALARALQAAGREPEAEALDREILRAAPGAPGPARRAALRALEDLAPAAARALLAPARAAHPQDPWLLDAEAAIAALEDAPETALALHRAAFAAAPQERSLRLRLARAEAEAGSVEAALRLVAPLAEAAAPRDFPALAALGMLTGRAPVPLAQLRAAARAAPGDPAAAEALRGALELAGETQEAAALAAASLAGGDPLPVQLAALTRAAPQADPARRRFLEAAARRLPMDPRERPAWVEAGLRGAAMTALLRRHCLAAEAAPEVAAQLRAVCPRPDLGPVRAALAAGRGCALLCSHNGPTAGATWMLKDAGLPLRSITSGSVGAARVRALRAHLAGGGALGAAPDWAAGAGRGRARDMPCARGRILLSELPGRLAFAAGAPSFWVSARWSGAQVETEIRPLIAPAPGEPREAFLRRWRLAVVGALEQVLAGSPQDLALGPVWRRAALGPLD